MSRSLSLLTPYMQKSCLSLISLSKEKLNLDIIITSTARYLIEQKAIYAQGREPLSIVNALRVAAKLPPISQSENSYKVTWTLLSYHIIDSTHPLARAFDIAILLPNNQPTWDIKVDTNHSSLPDYDEVGQLGESLGLVWGGRFVSPDRPHFQEPKNK